MELEGVNIQVNDTPASDAQVAPAEAPAGQEPAVEKDWAKEAQKLQEILNRKDKQLNKERAEKAELARIKELYEAEKNAPKPPKAEDFTDITDEIAAKLEYQAAVKAHNDKMKALQEPPKVEQPKQYSPEFVQAAQTTAEKVNKAKAENPAFRQLVDQNVHVIDNAPDHIYEAFFALENPEAALFQTLQNGEFEALLDLPPAVAAVKIAMAEQKGKMAMRPPVTKASPPIAPARGTSSVKTPDALHGHDLVKWLSS